MIKYQLATSAWLYQLRNVMEISLLSSLPLSLTSLPWSPTLWLQKPRKAEGYPDDAHTLFTTTSVADFITGDDHLALLGSTSQLVFDKPSEVFSKHPLTTEEIKLHCEDIKVGLCVIFPCPETIKWRYIVVGFKPVVMVFRQVDT